MMKLEKKWQTKNFDIGKTCHVLKSSALYELKHRCNVLNNISRFKINLNLTANKNYTD